MTERAGLLPSTPAAMAWVARANTSLGVALPPLVPKGMDPGERTTDPFWSRPLAPTSVFDANGQPPMAAAAPSDSAEPSTEALGERPPCLEQARGSSSMGASRFRDEYLDGQARRTEDGNVESQQTGRDGDGALEGAAGTGPLSQGGIATAQPSLRGALKGGSAREAPEEGVDEDNVVSASCAPPGSLPLGPNGGFRIHAVTWNMAQGDGFRDTGFPHVNLVPDALLCAADRPGILAVGTQETGRWEEFVGVVGEKCGACYQVLSAHRTGALGIVVMCHRSMQGLVASVKTDTYLMAAVELVNKASKGAVAVSLSLRGGFRVLLVNSHLPAGEGKASVRNKAYHRIKKGLFPGLAAEQHAKNATNVHDLTVWMGDLNYRVRSNRAAADRALALDMPQVLLGNDELRQEQRFRRSYVHFHEPPIRFHPSYKFDLGTDTYDTSKKERIPSWTDRILYKTALSLQPQDCTAHRYSSVAAVRTSDHKPVVLTLDVSVAAWEKEWRDRAGIAAEDRIVVAPGGLLGAIGCCSRPVVLGPGMRPVEDRGPQRRKANQAVMPSDL